MSAVSFTEVRTTSGFKYTDPEGIFGYIGHGFVRDTLKAERGVNAGSPFSLHKRGGKIDGILPGEVKVTRLKQVSDLKVWYSLRSMGPKGNGRVVYVREDTLVAVVGVRIQTIDSLYHASV